MYIPTHIYNYTLQRNVLFANFSLDTQILSFNLSDFFYGLEDNHIVAIDKTCQVAKSFFNIPQVHSSDGFMLLDDRFTYVRIR